jgi:hypothetical protein
MSTREGVYVSGDYYLLCDTCGFKKRRSECAKDWEGKMVCMATCLDERNPQDYIHARAERQAVVDARYAEPTYVSNASYVASDYVDPDYV